MEKNPIEVMTLDSESEDELQIVSENITNYGNYSKPVEISPELQEKILRSLQKSAFPGKIQSLKIVATKTKNNEKGTVIASFNSANGVSQVINVGPDFKEHFVKQVQGEINNNVDPLAINSKESKGAKRKKYVSQSRSNNPKAMRDVKLSFPIRKVKQSHLGRKKSLERKTPTNGQLKNLIPQNQTSTDPLLLDVPQNSDPLLLDTNDQVFEEASSILNQEVVSLESPPIQFARFDEDHEEFIEKSLESNNVVKRREEWQVQERKLTKENNNHHIYQVQQKRNNRGKEASISNIPLNQREFPPLCSTIFPPSPLSPPPPVWHNPTSLWQLETHEFEEVTDLCRNEAAVKGKGGSSGGEIVKGQFNGELEGEHRYVCTVCAEEYDDLQEVMHHKWERHPFCLVDHVTYSDANVTPLTMCYPHYPQVNMTPAELCKSAKKIKANGSSDEKETYTCTKCQERLVSRDDFHIHILICSGIVNWTDSTKKRKGKRGKNHGGSLKHVINNFNRRMQAKQESGGTDTDGESTPKKRTRTMTVKEVAPVSFIPRHSRTTRLKENMKKVVKNLAAKESRKATKDQNKKMAVNLNVQEDAYKRKVKRKILLDDNTASEEEIISDVLDGDLSKIVSVENEKKMRPKKVIMDYF